MTHKSGFVNIVGNPNVGKSTLMNALVDERLSVVTAKAQTTRHRIMGIISGDDYQIVYSDTPGIIKPNYKMQEGMMQFVDLAFTDADVLLYVTDVVEKSDKHSRYLDKVRKLSCPVLVLINKIDVSNPEAVNGLINYWQEAIPQAEVIPISAQERFNLQRVHEAIQNALPEGPAYFPKDEISDKSDRFFVSEILRGSIFENYRKEIPYSTEVVIESFKEEAEILRLQAVIYVERESQKGILLGKGGVAMKHTLTEARKDMEHFFRKKVFLQAYIKVKNNWRNNEGELRSFGYMQ